VSGRREHYSYTYYADAANAQSFDARRFGGPIGDLVARGQADILADMLGSVQGRRILDVGTGTGRAAFILAAAGAQVTGVDASEQMLAIARERAAQVPAAAVDFRVGDAHALDFGDREFDIVTSLRVLMHTPRWRQCIAEICRVASHAVVIDYPAVASTALVQSMLRKVLHPFGLSSEPYRVFSDAAIARELRRHGFRVTAIHRQFVLPIAVHKTIGSRSFTETSERWLANAGLLRLFGSPVTVYARRG
jgi:ubiquinone/menaquinone biosynthesis C-methylase UbiE